MLDGGVFKSFMGSLSNTERKRVQSELMQWKGSCWGMSSTAILVGQGVIDAGQLAQGIKCLSSVNSGNLSEQTQILINCYQMIQFTKPVSQRIRRFQKDYAGNDKAKSDLLIQTVEAGKPTLLCYTYKDSDKNCYGHAVVAYDVEPLGIQTIPLEYAEGTEYFAADKRILIYNPNEDPNLKTDMYNMYINSDTGEWLIKMTNDEAEYGQKAIRSKGISGTQRQAYLGEIGFICNDPEILNYRGPVNGTDTLAELDGEELYEDGYYAEMRVLRPTGESQINQAPSDPYDGGFHAENDKNSILYTANFFGENDPGHLTAVVYGDRCYYVSARKAQKLELDMEYEHCLLEASAETATRITVSPASRLDCENVSGEYRLSMVQDEGYHPTDWYQLTVTGTDGGHVQLTPEETGGWLLKGDSLKNVTVSVSNEDNEASVTFSTPYKAVHIYEIDETTVGIRADAEDGTGRLIAQTVHPLSGDLDADRSLSMADAVRLARLIAETESDDFTADENADVDEDGLITVFDLTALFDKLLKQP